MNRGTSLEISFRLQDADAADLAATAISMGISPSMLCRLILHEVFEARREKSRDDRRDAKAEALKILSAPIRKTKLKVVASNR